MPVVQVPFGNTPDGRAADLFVLKNKRGLQLEFTNLGCVVTRILAPDREGRFENINLGFSTLLEYFKRPNAYGALIGRYVNRIPEGRFQLDGKTYELARNKDGRHHIHGGVVGFHRRLWKAQIDDPAENRVALRYHSPDGEENYPGNLDVTVVYSLTDDDEWLIDYTATTDAPTPINLTQHAYFNLTGCKRDTLGHELSIKASRYTISDAELLATGEIASVEGTPLDFRRMKPIERDMAKTAINGYDNNFIIDRDGVAPGEMAPCAEVHEPESGRTISVRTTEPAVQLYNSNTMDGQDVGLDGIVYKPYWGLCLETQHYPNAVNIPSFPNTILRPGETYRQTTGYRFGAK